jgi:hypothetical protein
MAMFIVRKPANRGGATTQNNNDVAIVSVTSENAARILAGLGQPGGPEAWADAEVMAFDEDILKDNGQVIRFQSTSDTPEKVNWKIDL